MNNRRRSKVAKRVSSTREVIDRETRQLVISQVAEYLRDNPVIIRDHIAHQTGVSNSKVGTLVKEAFRDRIFQTIHTPPLEEKLQEEVASVLREKGHSHIRQCVCVFRGQASVASAAARHFENSIDSARTNAGCALVVDGGKTVSDFVAQIARVGTHPVSVAAICTDPPSYQVSAFELMTQLAFRFRWKALKLPYGKLNDSLSGVLSEVQRIAKSASFVALGVGPWEPGNTALDFVEHLGEDKNDLQLRYQQIAGVAGYCCLSENGEHLQVPGISAMHRAITYSDMKSMSLRNDCTIAVLASGAHKAKALAATIRARICNTVFLDADTARELIRCI